MLSEEIKPEETKEAPLSGAKDIKAPQENKALPAEAPAKEAKAKPEPEKKEKPANCPICNKSLKKMWYYRNGVYYCGKGCFRQAGKKAAAEKKKAADEPRLPEKA